MAWPPRIVRFLCLITLAACDSSGGGSGGTAPAPEPAFTGTPQAGVAPLQVQFTDETVGAVTEWYWDFGDGDSSTQQNPAHVFQTPGPYTVKLITVGPGGHAETVQTDYVAAIAPIGDPSFEGQVAGTPPAAPWILFFGGAPASGHVIEPSTAASTDNGMPSQGSRWCEIGADSTDNATPPSNPGGFTDLPVGGAGIRQDFRFPVGRHVLQFEAAFVLAEGDPVFFNDWMSVDVRRGVQAVNVYYRDGSSSVAGTSAKYEFTPITPVETVTVDLLALFPDATTDTVFTLFAQVGNAVDDVVPSQGYVDGFRFAAPGLVEVDFAADDVSGQDPFTTTFEPTVVQGQVTGWSWDFGDGNASTQAAPTHEYGEPGRYTVALTASGAGASHSVVKPGFISVGPGPMAAFTATPAIGPKPLLVQFTNDSIDALSFEWDFGDGTSSTAEDPPPKSYATEGNYTVTLTAFGRASSDSVSTTVHVYSSWPQIYGYLSTVHPGCCAACTACHSGATPEGGLALDNIDLAFDELKAETMTCGPGVQNIEVVKDFLSAQSALVIKLKGLTAPLNCGGQMPDCFPACSLSTQKIVDIENWIDFGAPETP